MRLVAEPAKGCGAVLVGPWSVKRVPAATAARACWICKSIAAEDSSNRACARRSESSATAIAAWKRRRASRSRSGAVSRSCARPSFAVIAGLGFG